MTRARRPGRRIGIVAGSVALHLALAAALAVNVPRFVTYVPPPVYEVTVTPLYLPPEKAPRLPRQRLASRPLVPRMRAKPDEPLPVAPLVTPAAPARNAPGAFSVSPDERPAPKPPGAADQVREILRNSLAGCANADSVIFSKRERGGCDERFGSGAKDAPFIEPPMSRDKRRAFDAAAARKEAYVKYKESNLPPGLEGGGLGPATPTVIPQR